MSSLLHVIFTSSEGSINIKNSIPTQDLTLKHYRLEFSTQAQAQAIPCIGLDLPFITIHNINSSDNSNAVIPILGGNNAIINQNTDYKMAIHKTIPTSFKYKIIDQTTNLPLTDGEFLRLDCIFEYSEKRSNE